MIGVLTGVGPIATTAILVKIPGDATSVVTVLDGHQMAKEGRPGVALGIAALRSPGSRCAGGVRFADGPGLRGSALAPARYPGSAARMSSWHASRPRWRYGRGVRNRAKNMAPWIDETNLSAYRKIIVDTCCFFTTFLQTLRRWSDDFMSRAL
jgi:hypothetical protein